MVTLKKIGELNKKYMLILDKHNRQELTENQAMVEAFPVLVEMMEVFDLLATMTQGIVDTQSADIQTLSEMVDTLTADNELMRNFIAQNGLNAKFRNFSG